MSNSFKFIFPVAIAAMVLFSCKNEVKKPDVTVAQPVPTTAVPTKPEVEMYVAAVDKLRLRETPEANGKVITLLDKFAALTATGKRSDQKVSMPFDEFDYFYEMTSADGKTGWVFGPTILKVYAGSKADALGADFSGFAAGLGKLPKSSIESGGKAYELLKTMMPKSGDAAFILTEKMLRDLQFDPKISSMFEGPAITKKLESEGTKVWEHTFDHQKYPETKRAADNGFKVTTTEGSYFPTLDYEKLKAAFAGKLTAPTAAWLDQTIAEDLDPSSSDGGLIISLEEVAKRAIFWENWLAANPNHVLADDAALHVKWLNNDLMMGQDNTPMFDYETKKPTAEAQAVWAHILKTYPNSKLATGIGQFMKIVEADGGVRGEKTEAFIQKLLEM